MQAIEMVDGRPTWSTEECIGCGLCATGCPNDAIRMERSVEVPEPAADVREMGLQILKDSGKLEDFLAVVKPAGRPTGET
jgi:Fe-S-cluster-containing hydrogenase component 2